MATPSAARPGRTIAVLAVLTALIYGAIFFAAPDSIGKHTLTLAEKYQPRLGLDLEGGTSVILTPRLTKGSGSVPKDSLNQAVSIIRNRVDSFGVAESEVTTAGNNIVISIPGKQDKNILATVQQTAELRFRPVLVSGAGSATPRPERLAVTDGLRRSDAQHVHQRHAVAVADHEHQQRRGAQGAAQGGQRRDDAQPDPDRVGQRSSADRPGADHDVRRRDHPRPAAEVRRAGLRRRRRRSARAAHPRRGRPEEAAGHLQRGRRARSTSSAPAEVLGTDVKSAQRRPCRRTTRAWPPAAGRST